MTPESAIAQPNFVLIAGNSGAGKSTLSAGLAEATGYPVLHLDHILFSRNESSDNGRGSSKQQFFEDVEIKLQEIQEAARNTGGSIVDGNYLSLHALTWDRASHIAFLDPSLAVITHRLIRRIILPPRESESYGNAGYSFREIISNKNPLRVARQFNLDKRPKIISQLEIQRQRGATIIHAASLTPNDILTKLSQSHS